MTQQLPPAVTPPPAAATDRPVLCWRPDVDESHVQPSVAGAAALLGLPADTVLAAIDSGDLIGGWFVDWAPARTA